MKTVDLSNVSAHVVIDRQVRFNIIENTVGWGTPLVEAPDKKEQDATATLTSTGVIIIMSNDGMIITAWIASVRQAVAVYARATGNTKLPRQLWNMVNYNNNTEVWNKIAA